ncbi:AAA domain-containing protein [Pavlovales sp. CCMP2436]|nr:AAA domain-containing protein [Pavlovales sp. CCMP2436]
MSRAAGIPTRLAAFGVWGSGTGVGKTLVSAGLFAAARRRELPTLYLKPVQTGFPRDSDGALVAALGGGVAHALGAHAASAASLPLALADSDARAPCRTLFAWRDAVGPHLAVEREGRAVGDAEILASTRDALVAFARGADASAPALALVETAGGPASPGPSGTLQADLLRPLRLPCVLVGDGGLGGISATLCAHDALTMRGLDTPLLVLLDGGLGNEAAIARHTRRAGTRVFAVPPLAKPAGGGEASTSAVAEWLRLTAPHFDELLACLGHWQNERLAALAAAPAEAASVYWWPFTQHALAGPVTVIKE